MTPVAGVRVPDSDAARAAERLSREASPRTLYAHAVRSFLYASLLAKRDRERVDEEALYVGCVLHDIGLTSAHEHLSRFPRGPFKREFSELMQEEARRKPGCAAAAANDPLPGAHEVSAGRDGRR
jgi:hypothetical protein